MLNEEETTNIIPSYLARRNWTQQQSSPWPCCGIKQADYFSWLECRRVDLKRLHVSIARHQCFFCARHMFSCRPTVHWRKNTLFQPVFQNALVVKAAGINWEAAFRLASALCCHFSIGHWDAFFLASGVSFQRRLAVLDGEASFFSEPSHWHCSMHKKNQPMLVQAKG